MLMKDTLAPFLLVGIELRTFSVECGLVATGAGAVRVLVSDFVVTGWWLQRSWLSGISGVGGLLEDGRYGWVGGLRLCVVGELWGGHGRGRG